MLTNIFVFGPEVDLEYIRIRIRVKKNIPNIIVFVFGSQNNIRYALRYFSDPKFFRTQNLFRTQKFFKHKIFSQQKIVQTQKPFLLKI